MVDATVELMGIGFELRVALHDLDELSERLHDRINYFNDLHSSDATCYCTIATFACGHQFHNLRVLPRLDEEAKCQVPAVPETNPSFRFAVWVMQFQVLVCLSGATMNVAYSCELDNVLLPCLDAVATGKTIAGVSRARQERRWAVT
ncbi:hypothetical protein PRNP1_012913 [Phytophthora ramorum]